MTDTTCPEYLDAVRAILTHLEQTQLPGIEQAADLIVQALTKKGAIYCAQIGHGIQGDFIGRAALERAKAAGLTRALVGLEMVDRGIARDEYCCCNESGEPIGVITSGSPSPTLGKNIALAYVPPAMTALGTPIYVQIRAQKCKAHVVATPFYKRAKKSAAPQTAANV